MYLYAYLLYLLFPFLHKSLHTINPVACPQKQGFPSVVTEVAKWRLHAKLWARPLEFCLQWGKQTNTEATSSTQCQVFESSNPTADFCHVIAGPPTSALW